MTIFQGPLRHTIPNAIGRPIAGAGLLLLAACAAEGPEQEGPVFYPAAPEIPRVQYLTTINTEEDVGGETSEFRAFLLGTDEPTAGLVRPFDVAHEKGKIYVIDRRFQAVVVIDLAESRFNTIKETAGGPLRKPMSIFVADDGYKYVADRDRGQVIVLDQQNEFHNAYGAKGQFQPLDVVVHGDRIYVCDVKENEIEVLDKNTGELITKIGEPGPDDGQFHWPTHLAIDSEGNLYVTDFLNFRVQKFDPNGNFVRAIGQLGNFPGSMPRPKGIVVDDDGHLYAVDSAFELIQIFDTGSAEVLLGFGKFGPKPGGSWLPAGIDIDYDNLGYFSEHLDPDFRAKYLIYVANQAGPAKLNVYAFGEWTGPAPKGAQPARKEDSPEE
ncbi:MAG: 6-bladed beta-propeller [Rhodospirillales bacterium]|nr:6-bladed beta-propeller [Rhodospirillales bacterium]MDH3792996.1 6-bladed beta-propeller [Rhodospirillales bacterium]MDH3910265.1 6-bladed beta-propeller [Rhodospirillales bacterium]MDH3920799.1 6-bladed beta-propeller [Rhodospirillales bacterium]MDH3966095.1 6-bladed beta-propeller [Rhodospirillales bacterium]